MKKSNRLKIADFDHAILDWIDNHILEQPRLDDLASWIGYSKRMIQLHFQDKYGMSIGDYINNRRLYRACSLLRMTDLPIVEIACALHYDNHNNFCRAFKKKLNCTPLEFRRLPQHLLPTLPIPETIYRGEWNHHLVTFTNKVLRGVHFQYEDNFIRPGSLGAPVRLQRLRAWFKDNHTSLTIASDILRGSSAIDARQGLITVSAIAGSCINADSAITAPEPEGAICYPLDGLYLCCPFTGSFEEYAKHCLDIYRCLLPKLKYTRREARDVEVFYFTHHIFDDSPMIFCEHYIPVAIESEPPYPQ